MEFLDLPALHRAAGVVRLPGSKSISNRVLLLAGLAEGQTRVHDLLETARSAEPDATCDPRLASVRSPPHAVATRARMATRAKRRIDDALPLNAVIGCSLLSSNLPLLK